MKQISRLLKRDGCALIRIPVASNYVWREFGTNWVQIDAPRHMFLHTRKSIDLLAEKSGLKCKDVVFDSTDFQFWGSKQYELDIPLMSNDSYYFNKNSTNFTKSQIKEYKRLTKTLNETGESDAACFYLYKP
jgi:hypothetical protein